MDENDVAAFDLEDSQELENLGLATQDINTLDLDNATVDTLEIMSRQATINVGTIGHVAHGKSTVVRAISGVKTQKHRHELVSNATINLGYANAKLFRCPQCPRPQCYRSFGSSQADETACPTCGAPMKLLRHLSFVDCPGHGTLMSTMLNGAAVMDAALLLIAADETFPQPQTLEHLQAVEIMKLKQLLVLQNKIDLVSDVAAEDQYEKIYAFLESRGKRVPIIPISAQKNFNVEYLLEYLCHLPLPRRNLRSGFRLTVIRSFDINKPRKASVETLRGGVIGGTITSGVLKLDQVIEILPGVVCTRVPPAGGPPELSYRPLRTKVTSLKAEGNSLQYAIPGGLIAIGTILDPSLTRNNKMVGALVGDEGSLPPVWGQIDVSYDLFSELHGGGSSAKKVPKVGPLMEGEQLQLNVGSLKVSGTVLELTKHGELSVAQLVLSSPLCCECGERVCITRTSNNLKVLIGYGEIKRGKKITPVS